MYIQVTKTIKGISSKTKFEDERRNNGADTKERIRQVAKDMGYFPNSAAKALKTNRTYNIGVLFVDEARSGLTHNYFSHVLDSFKQTAEQQGYDMTFINCCKSRPNRMTYLEHARYRGFDGVVIACIDFNDPEVTELVKSNIPIVTIDHLFHNRVAVMSDNAKGMEDLFSYIYSMGHRKIAYIHGADSAVTQSRLSTFYRMAEEKGLQIPDMYVKEAAYRSADEAYERTQELLALNDRPTCILYQDDYASFGGIKAIRQAGLKIPQDISVAGYDGIRLAYQLEPQLTTLKQNTECIGRMAAEQLIHLIEEPKTTLIRPYIVEGSVEKGESVKDINIT